MATEIGNPVTLLDLARALDPSKKIAAVAEMMAQTNEILDDIPWIECNNGTGHVSIVRTGLPGGTWRKFNQRIGTGKSTRTQATDTCGMLRAYAEVDSDLVKLYAQKEAFLMSENKAFIEGLGQDLAYGLFYADTAIAPEQIMGLAPRFDTPSATETDPGSQLIDGLGSGSDNTSLWLIVWGEGTVHGLYPKGSKAGLSFEYKGQQTSETSDGLMEVDRTLYQWDVGLCVRDWRAIVRICNLDVSDLATAGADTDTSANLINLMIEATERIPSALWAGGRAVWYCNKRVKSALKKQLINRNNTLIGLDTFTGTGGIIRPMKTLTFEGIPIRQVDKIGIAEEHITGTFWS